MFVPRSVGRKKAAVATSDTSSARPAESLASTPASTSSSISLPSTPVAAAALSTTGPPPAPPASSTASTSALSKAEVKAAEQQQARTGRLARELALVLALVLSEDFLAADAGPAGSGLELGKWLTRVNYLPLSTLLKHPLFHPLPSPLPPPAALAKAIRQYAPALGARLVLDEPRSFGGQRGQKEGSGGLEIGRVDGAAGRAVVDQSGSEQELARKVYVEYLPTQLHTAGALLSFFSALISQNDASAAGDLPVINLSPPPYRNYCRLTFNSAATANRFLADWSWTGAKDRAAAFAAGHQLKIPAVGEASEGERGAAIKAGMRALGQAEFDKLEKEYLALLESRRPPPAPPSPIRAVPPHLAQTASVPPAAPTAPAVGGDSSNGSGKRVARSWPERPPAYPEGCVVFLRALDPATSKTALKDTVNHLLSRVAPGRGDAVVSYVDWVKGADTAHIRLPHSSLSAGLLSQLAAEPTVHLPLSAGPPYLSPPVASIDPSTLAGVPLAAEVIRGERERLYWLAGAVREAGRVEAVRVSLAWESSVAEADVSDNADVGGGKRKATTTAAEEGSSRKKGGRRA